GHYLCAPGGGHFRPEKILPFRYEAIDGLLYSNAKQSLAVIMHILGYTIMMMGDYSADTRGGSNAAFLASGTFNFNEMKELAQKFFPEQLKRIEAAAPI